LIEGKIAIPAPEDIKPEPLPTPDPATKTEEQKSVNTPTSLQWSKTLEYDEKTKRAKLTIHGLNKREEEIGFAYLEVKFLVNDKKRALFNGNKFKVKHHTLIGQAYDTITHLAGSTSTPQQPANAEDGKETSSIEVEKGRKNQLLLSLFVLKH
jgi:hypothetical protein